MEWIRSTPIAHRGLHDAAQGLPENSLAAFRAAASAGYAMEFDVRLTRDGVAVVIHDHHLLRLTGHDAEVSRCSLAELGELELAPGGAPLGAAGGPHRIPTLSAVLDLVAGQVPLFIELKNHSAPGLMEETVARQLGGYRGPWAVGSFNPMSLAWFKEYQPQAIRGQISGSLNDSQLDDQLKQRLSNLEMNPFTEPHFVGYELSALPHPAVSAAQQQGMPIVAWTVMNKADQQRAQELADNFIFEAIRP